MIHSHKHLEIYRTIIRSMRKAKHPMNMYDKIRNISGFIFNPNLHWNARILRLNLSQTLASFVHLAHTNDEFTSMHHASNSILLALKIYISIDIIIFLRFKFIHFTYKSSQKSPGEWKTDQNRLILQRSQLFWRRK